MTAPPPAAAMRPRRLALLTLPGLDHFVADLVAGLPCASGWEVRQFMVTEPRVLQQAMAWADDAAGDALWFEFCWPPFPAMIAAADFGGRRVIVRVHRIEAAETSLVADTAWEKVDDVIVVSPDMRRRVLAAAPEIALTTRLTLACNGVDAKRFAACGEASRSPFRVGWCGLMNLRKNPIMALQILRALRDVDDRYHLSLCSMAVEKLAHESFVHLARRLGLAGSLLWEGRLDQAAMPAWHARNVALLHTSMHEGLSYAVLEAAAAGCDLAVFDHPGATECWPAEVLFGTVDEAVRLIRAAQPGRRQTLVRERYSLERQLGGLSAMLNAPRGAVGNQDAMLLLETSHA